MSICIHTITIVHFKNLQYAGRILKHHRHFHDAEAVIKGTLYNFSKIIAR